MQQFKVLDRHQNILQNYLLEASAGTGKTFSIEHLVVRLLLEANMKIEQIAIVTFTKAATRDLKLRIRNNLEKALHLLQGSHERSFDYLNQIIEKGDLAIRQAIRQIEHALFCFDQACIYTIHGFCARALRDDIFEGDVSLGSAQEEGLPRSCLLQIIRNFFRTGIHPQSYHPIQMGILIKSFRDLQTLESKLASTLASPRTIIKADNYAELLDRFLQIRSSTKQILISKESLQTSYKGKTKKETLQEIEQFLTFWQKPEWDEQDFHYLIKQGFPILKTIPALKDGLCSIVEQAADPDHLFARLAYDVQELLEQYLHEEERGGFDSLLLNMQKAVKNPNFVQKIRQKFKAAIIDEFQDTDPIQWDIFHSLFMDSPDTFLYLVGDPKQSIYSFRQADIYTYLNAANAMGPDCQASLKTNFRSQPALIQGLNLLFSHEHTPDFITLPRLKTALEYQPVTAGHRTKERPFQDGWGAVHLCQSELEKNSLEEHEKQHFFPHIVQEITRLHEKEGFKLNQCAILVADRYQGERCATFLKQWNIPTANQKNTALSESTAVPALHELLSAVLHPKQDSLLRTALGGRLMGWTHDKILQLDDASLYEQTLLNFFALRKCLRDEGFGKFFYFFLQTTWLDSELTLAERLLGEKEGHVFFQELQQVAELLIMHEHQAPHDSSKLLEYLDELQTTSHEEESPTKRPLIGQDAVQVLSIHSSKGLEFPIVFALGLIKETNVSDRLIPVFDGTQLIFKAIPDKQDSDYLKFCEEIEAEKMRQLYVALTRAKYRIYVPIAVSQKVEEVVPGERSAMDLFIAKLSQKPRELVESINEPQALSFENLSGKVFDLHPLNEQNGIKLSPPPSAIITVERTGMYSYSMLTKSKVLAASSGAPHDFAHPLKSIHTLPTGSSVGTFLHKLLQICPFGKLENMGDWLQPHLSHSPYSEWHPVLTDMFCQVIHAPLKVGENVFSLSEINLQACMREMEFITPCQGLQALEEIQNTSGFLKGVIDMVFQHEGKYYLLDWKSNWLGPNYEAYNREKLELAMHEHQYFLQAAIYQDALKRYLALVDKRPFEEIYGGTLYIFLRGLHSQFPNNGVYAF